ncbi:hypothetical protein CBR_g38351 [Chara braunii]|uniref:Reverse transcriptase domain-containing protein n=1 Tax=Chara braunii TaxID=69332 RepID=A0A388LPX1_CHABU|nr:hypothetical protein CBR_g38351 [Chara braunii]|eukprot:GBG84378.1 hypothetical protein CBR_g38351 [Chara braunii]
MTKLQCEDRPFDFGEDARKSFLTLKTALLSAEDLRIYDPLLPTRVTTDASDYGIGVVLEQQDGVDWHPIEYFSKKVSVVHSIDDAHKKELLAFVHALKWWRHFLLGRSQFRWVTNNNPLVFYKTQHTVKSTFARWITFIDQFDFFPDHIPGKLNRFVDALSQRPDHCTRVYLTFEIEDDLRDSFIRGYQADPEFRDKYANCSSPNSAPSHYRIQEGYLLVHTRGKDLLCIPSDSHLRTRLLGEFQDPPATGHFGVNRTIGRLRERFWWPGLLGDVTRYCELCEVCRRCKSRNHRLYGELRPLPVPLCRREAIAMDITGSFPKHKTGVDGILTVVDRLTKFAMFLPCRYHAKAPKLAERNMTIFLGDERKTHPQWTVLKRSATSSPSDATTTGQLSTCLVVPHQQQCHVSNSATSAVPHQQECHVRSATSATVPRQHQCKYLQAEAAAVAEKQRLQAEADADAQVRRKEAQDLLQRHKAASIEKLKFWHFEPSENHEDATPEEQHKEFLAKLVTRLVYTCNNLQSELENLRRAVRNHKDQHEDATRALDCRVQDLEQVAPRPNAGESSSAPSTRQLEERVDHAVTMLGDISTFAATATISKQMDTLKTEVQQLHQLPNRDGNTSAQHYKMPTFRIEKFDDYMHQDPDYLHTVVPAQLMDVGVEVVDLHDYVVKIDREFKTQRPMHHRASRRLRDVFEAPHGVVPDRPIRHEITLEAGAIPLRGCIYRMSEEELSVLRAQLDDLLEKGWIRPSSSSYGAPVLFVRKKKKDLWLCIDYRKLNAQTVMNADPLQRIDNLLEQLGGAKFFYKLDLKSTYNQLKIWQEDRYKTGFKTRYGHFEWLVMPFGLTNAPATFQAAMTTEFRHILDRFVLIYLDDILVYSRSLDEHVEHLHTVLEQLRQAKYKANRDKCEFARQELEYLGHYVTSQGIRPLADKIEVIRVWPEPTNTTNVRSFMGLVSSYQRFIIRYSRISAPMTRLQSPKVPFGFDDDARRSFQALKTAMLMAPVLSIYDPTLATRVTTDASGYGIGAVLEQHYDDDKHPVEHFSHKVLPINSLDDARKRELLAFAMALKRWQHFLLGRRRFTWVTDNNPLIYYKTQDTVSSMIGRWMYFIDRVDFTSKHLAGLSNRAADALS